MVHRNRHALILGRWDQRSFKFLRAFDERARASRSVWRATEGSQWSYPCFLRVGGEGWGRRESNEREERGCDDFSIIDRQSDVLFAGDRVDRVDAMRQGGRHQTGGFDLGCSFLFFFSSVPR
jgi:hypothetical protein